jgi:hypothetical protein
MTGPHPIREVSERTARRIEAKLDLPAGWMDINDHHEVAADIDLVVLIRDVTRALIEEKVDVPSAKFGELVVLALEHSRKAGKVDIPWIRSVVRLIK